MYRVIFVMTLYIKEGTCMATKSFTTDMRFNRKNAQQLLEALENPNKPNLTSVAYEVISDESELDSIIDSVIRSNMQSTSAQKLN